MSRAASAFCLFLAYAVFVVYGSLVPLDFKAMPLDVAWARFQQIPYLNLGVDSRADWVANGVLYAPLAFWATRFWLQCVSARALAITVAWLVCTALAIAVEFTQLFFPPRTVSQNDLIAECIGSAVGAFAAPLLANWIDRIGQAWPSGGARLGARLLELYALAYGLLSFFPYDFLLSSAELQDKLHGGGWGWFLAPQQHGIVFVALQLAVETALAVPLGLLLARRRRTPWSTGAVAGVGVLIGLLIEGGQLLMESGVSQGASVLTRALGLVLGIRLAPHLQTLGPSGARAVLRRFVWPLTLLYLLLLGSASGIFDHRWRSGNGIGAAWSELRLMPFYYHYYTTEAAALFSLGRVTLLYAPVAVLGWAIGWPVRKSVVTATALALLVELAKLAGVGVHADPTNLLIAAASTAAAAKLLAMSGRAVPAGAAATTPRAPAVASAAAVPAYGGSSLGMSRLLPLLALPVVVGWVLRFPLWQAGLLALLSVCAAAVWRRPVLALALVPAALPVLDLAPWSGRFFCDEFDLLMATVIAVAWARTPGNSARHPWRAIDMAFAVLGLSLAVSAWRGMGPWVWPDANAFSSYHSPYNAVRIVKGALWAWLYVRLWQRLEPAGAERARLFGAGMVAGLALTVLAVIWERLVFTGLWDFAADFRVSGPISAMHKGGAYIECWLAAASAFVVMAVLRPARPLLRAFGVLLLAGAGYATLVTYSRNGYAAFAAVLVVALASSTALRSRSWRPRAWAALSVAVVVCVAVPVLLPAAGGSYARERLARSGQDLATREAHWADGLALRDDTMPTTLFGMGIGRFPATHFWRSREPQHAASYQLAEADGQTFLRLGAGATLYVEQIVARPAGGALRLSLDLRSAAGSAVLAVSLCEKWGLSSLGCVNATASAAGPARNGGWQHVELPLDASTLLHTRAFWHAPLKLALATPATGTVDVARVRLDTGDGQALIANGDFAHGMDRWFFSTDIDPPWHLHSLPVAVLFDQGWFGVLAWAAVVLTALWSGARLALRGQAQVGDALAAATGFLISASLNTLIDSPRFLWLLLVLLWLATAREPGTGDGATRSARGRGGAATAMPVAA